MKLVLNTPFSDAFTKHIQTQIAQVGWANGDEKSPLGEYICLMIANGKDEEQIAAELSTDLVSPVPGGATPASFAHWVFAELARLSGGEEEDQNAKVDDNTSHGNEDAEMTDMGEQPTEEGVYVYIRPLHCCRAARADDVLQTYSTKSDATIQSPADDEPDQQVDGEEIRRPSAPRATEPREI